MGSSSTTKLGVVLSSGGWHTPALYAVFRQALEEQGVKTYIPLVPSLRLLNHDVTNEDDPAFDMDEPSTSWPQPDDDAAALEEDIVALLNQGRKVIVIAHSMGGQAATQASKPEYQYSARVKQGLSGGIIGLLYVSAYLLPVGYSVNEIVGEDIVPPFSRLHKHGKRGLTTPVRMREFFFAGVSEADAAYYSKLMRAQSVPTCKLTNDPYTTYPLGYVVCQRDMALPPEAQERMCRAKIEDGCDVTVFRELFDHCPTVSAVERLVEIVLEFAECVQR